MKALPVAAAIAALAACAPLAADNGSQSNVEVSSGAAGAASVPPHKRALSDDLSKALSFGIKYNPPPPPKPEEEDVDLRDVDKPRNEIIRLPKYVVESERPAVFSERNLYSKEMLRRLALQRFTSEFSRNFLNRYHLFGRADEAYAMMEFEAEERAKNMAEMEDRVSMYRVSGDKAEADSLEDDTQRTFMRRTDYSTPPTTNGQGTQ